MLKYYVSPSAKVAELRYESNFLVSGRGNGEDLDRTPGFWDSSDEPGD